MTKEKARPLCFSMEKYYLHYWWCRNKCKIYEECGKEDKKGVKQSD